jgi:dimeric dUTPase (all-alpha-NTP-PPase superfamily)
MNLEKLFQTQKVLRDRIGYNEPDRFNKLILALLVELGECANEWRGFKFWSVNQLPHTSAVRVPCMMEEDKEYYNPLLEEYVDCLHFILEIGLEIGLGTPEYPISELEDEIIPELYLMKNDVTQMFNSVIFYAVMMKEDDYYFELVNDFVNLGKMLGFTWEQIEHGYFTKNKINHTRQSEGY